MKKYKKMFQEAISYPEANKILKPYGFKVVKGKGYVYFKGIASEASLTHDSLETFDLSGWDGESLKNTLVSRIVEADFEEYKNSTYGKKFEKELRNKAHILRNTWSIYY